LEAIQQFNSYQLGLTVLQSYSSSQTGELHKCFRSVWPSAQYCYCITDFFEGRKNSLLVKISTEISFLTLYVLSCLRQDRSSVRTMATRNTLTCF